MSGLKPLRVLVSTDVLSEGVNLQDATLIVNYDLHWNPVRLMQRIGRVDRRMDATIEQTLVAARPSAAASRGKVQVRNFLPPDALERLLKLHQRVETKVLMISKTLGIPGGKLLTADDMLDDVKVMQAFREEYEGDLSPLEALRLEYLRLTTEDPTLEGRLELIPIGVSSAKAGSPPGIFACRLYPTLERAADGADDAWTMRRPKVEWVMVSDSGTAIEDFDVVSAAIRCKPAEPVAARGDRGTVRKALRGLETQASQRYRLAAQLPLDSPLPQTLCWMEIR